MLLLEIHLSNNLPTHRENTNFFWQKPQQLQVLRPTLKAEAYLTIPSSN